MATTHEEVALQLSTMAVASQGDSENQIRAKATAILSAASIVVPVAGVAIARGSAWPVIPLAIAALAYLRCVWTCAAALLPKNIEVGLLGGEMLKLATESGADVEQMQASASHYMDRLYANNQLILEKASENVKGAIIALGIEIVALTAAIPVTLWT
ncbi:MAG TPA: hypothetical protein VMB05_16940 [Solirubrobacteraceae bacterium]|nr:hypothetical protein [Solirubrobacteraceae bacterium]